MKILIKSEDAKKLTKLLEQMDVTDTGVELGDDLFVDGKIIVNSADDVVDINGQPIAGGGDAWYKHSGYLEDPDSHYYNYKLLSRASTPFTSIEQLRNDDQLFFPAVYEGFSASLVDVGFEEGKSGNFWYLTTLDGETTQWSDEETISISDTVD